jgi:hypothetical protein
MFHPKKNLKAASMCTNGAKLINQLILMLLERRAALQRLSNVTERIVASRCIFLPTGFASDGSIQYE